MKKVKVTDFKLGKEVEMSVHRFAAAQKLYPNRFELAKKAPKVEKEEK